MNILITGANGFIGTHLRDHLKSSHTIFSIYRKNGHSPVSSHDLEMDLSDVDYVKTHFTAAVFKQQIDVIIHCAAVLSNSDNKDIEVFHQNNRITESMIHVCGVIKAAKFINISTIGVYPNVSGTYNEGSAIEPSANHECLYSLSKVCSEELFKFYLKESAEVINLRLGQVYGAGMRQDRIFAIMKEELKKNNTITVYGEGERISNFVSIPYLIKKMDQLIYSNDVEGTFNLGEKNISYYQLAETIIRQFGNDSSEIILKTNGLRSKVMIDSSKINEL